MNAGAHQREMRGMRTMPRPYLAAVLITALLAVMPATTHAQGGETPAIPTGVSVKMTLGRIVVNWNPPSDPTVSGHRVYRQTEEQEETLAGETTAPRTTSLTDGGGQAGQTLTYRVTAVGPGGESERSGPASITLRPAPTGTTASAFHPTTGEEVKPGHHAFIKRPVDYAIRGDGRNRGRGWVTRITAPAIKWQGPAHDIFRRSTHPAIMRIYGMMISIIRHPAVTTIAPAE